MFNSGGDGSASLAVLQEHGLEDNLVEQAVADIQRIWSQGLLSTVVSLGDYLIEKFYGGDVDQARSRRPHKAAAFARLLERAEELPVSVHALKQSVRIAVQYHELPRALADRLSKTQHEVLLPVADPAQRLELATEAAAHELSSRQLAEKVSQLGKPNGGHSVGRPPSPPVVRRVGALVRVLATPGLDEELGPSALSALDPTQVEAVREQVRWARELLARLDDALEGTREPPCAKAEAPVTSRPPDRERH